MTPPPLPWERIIGFGLGVLLLAPAALWAMTPREFALAAEAVTGRAAPTIDRGRLAALVRNFPDTADHSG